MALATLCGGATPAQAATDGQPWARHTIDDSSKGADGVRPADANADGLPDIVTGWEQGGVVRVCFNPGPAKARSRWPAVTVGLARWVEDAVLVDVDADGAVDVVSSCEGRTRAMFVHWAPKERARYLDPQAWVTEPIPASTNAMMWMFCLPMQVDGKHGIDLVAGGKGPGAAIGWFEAPANLRRLAEWNWHEQRPAGWVMSLVASDMDGDGDHDVVFTDRKGQRGGCSWLENPGAASAQLHPWKEHTVGGAGREVMFLHLADLDRDGLEDVLVSAKPRQILFLRRLDRTGERWEPHAIECPPDTGTAKAVTAADLDLDGKLDLIFTCEQATAPRQGVMWLANDNPRDDAGWRPRVLGGVDGVKHDLVELLDLDGDGDLDVIACEEARNLGVFWYENPVRPAR